MFSNVTHAFLVCITSFFVISCLTSPLKWRTPDPLAWRQLLAPIRSLRRGSSPLTTGMSWPTFHPQTDRRLEPSGSFLWSRATSSRCQCATRPYSCFDLFQFHFLQLWLIEWKVHVARFGTDPSRCLKSVRFFKKGNISVGVDPSAVVGIKTRLRHDDAAVGPSVISCVSVQWKAPLHSMELQQKRMRQLPNQPPKTLFSCYLWFRREIWFVAWTALTERTPRDVWVKMSDRFIPRSRSSHMKLLSCSSNFTEWLPQSWQLQMSGVGFKPAYQIQ